MSRRARRLAWGAAAAMLVAVGAGPARAEGAASEANARPLSLEDALRLALANNPVLAGHIVDLGVARALALQASGLDDFVIGATGTWTHARGPNVNGQATPSTPYDSLDFAATLTRPLSTGGSVGVKLDAPWARLGSSAATGLTTDTADVYQPSAQLVVTQPLLRGRGYDVARAPLRRARAQRDVAGWDLEAAADGLARDVAVAYWELAFANGSLALERASLEAARAQLRATQAQIDVGKLPASASAEVEVSIALREDETIDTEAASAQRGAELARLLGVDRHDAAPLRTTDGPEVAAAPDRDVLPRALERNADVASQRARALAATIDVDVTRNGVLPQLDVAASGGPMGASSDAAPALRTLAHFAGYTMQAGLVFQEPVERRAQRGARDAAEQLVTKAQAGERDARTRVAANATSAVAALDATRRRVELLTRAVQVAALDLEGEQARFQANRSTNFDVLRRQQALTDVRVRLLRAQIDNAETSAALDALTDDILERHGLTLRAPDAAQPASVEGR